MKTELNGRGLLVITPENGCEEYALRQWIKQSKVMFFVNVDSLPEKSDIPQDQLILGETLAMIK